MADRATGQLEATAGATFMNLSWPVLEGFPATAEAQFGDTLFFTAQGASPTTLTTIGFTVHINGTLAFIPGLGSGSGAPEANFAIYFGEQILRYTDGFNPTGFNDVAGGTTQGVSYVPPTTQDVFVNQDIAGTISFEGPAASFPILMLLTAGGQYGYASFGDTATFSFDPLPTGVSYTSASRDFLAGTVPTLDQDTGEQAALSLAVNGGHPIGAATASAVPFTVGGPESDDSGTVTFSDGNTAHDVVVNIVNGVPAASTANLTGLTDGAIAATLHLNNDAAGNSFTNVTANATLDQDSGEQAALKLTVNGGHPIGAATASAVPFTVGGLESDDSGTVGFSDGSHAAVVINITSGVLAASTANLAGLNEGSITATLHVNNDAASNSFTNVTANATLDTDRLSETPTLTAPSSLTVTAGGSAPLGIVLTAADSDDTLSVSISGVPAFESVTAAGATPTVTEQIIKGNDTYTYTFSALPSADWNNGLILHSTFPGKGHPVNPLTVTASNTTTGESSTAPARTISVTDPPATTTPGYQDLGLLNQFLAAGFHEQDGIPIVASSRAENNWGQEPFLTQPHH